MNRAVPNLDSIILLTSSLVNPLTNLSKAARVEMNIPSQHSSGCVPHELCQFRVTDFSDGRCRVRVSVGIQNEILTSLLPDAGTLTQSSHFADDTVFGVRTSKLVCKYMFVHILFHATKPRAHFPDTWTQRNDAGSGILLSRDCLVLLDNPQAVLQIDHVPGQVTKLSGATACELHGDQKPLERPVGISKKSLELLGCHNSVSAASLGFDKANERGTFKKVISNSPVKHLLNGRDRVANCGRAVVPRHLLFDLRQVNSAKASDKDRSAQDLQRPTNLFLVVAECGGSPSSFDVGEVLVSKDDKSSLKPVAIERSFSISFGKKTDQLSLCCAVVAAKVMDLAVHLLAPAAAGFVEPRLIRIG